nr:MAG TPA: hypothetical protein [Caudoviricetes sp.]
MLKNLSPLFIQSGDKENGLNKGFSSICHHCHHKF